MILEDLGGVMPEKRLQEAYATAAKMTVNATKAAAFRQ